MWLVWSFYHKSEYLSCCSEEVVWASGTDQLIQVVLDPGQVGEGADGHQAAQSEVKELVAEERDQPSITMLKQSETRNQKNLEKTN